MNRFWDLWFPVAEWLYGCIICLLGRFDLMDSVGCECCMPNTRQLTSWQKPGTAGTFSISGTCSPCPSGTVADLDGATECAACAPGRGHLGLAVFSGPFKDALSLLPFRR